MYVNYHLEIKTSVINDDSAYNEAQVSLSCEEMLVPGPCNPGFLCSLCLVWLSKVQISPQTRDKANYNTRIPHNYFCGRES